MDQKTVAEATKRAWENRHSKTNQPLAPGADERNIIAQRQFCKVMGMSWEEWKPKGKTPGWDFQIGPHTVKIYAAPMNGNMLIKPRDVYASHYVLAYVTGVGVNQARLWGWARGDLVKSCHVENLKRDGAYKQLAHYVPAKILERNIDLLKKELGFVQQMEMF